MSTPHQPVHIQNAGCQKPCDQDTCDGVLSSLLTHWLESSTEELPSPLLKHLCSCRECLRAWIALEAASDLLQTPVSG
jgi:hypothetical protein